MYYSISSFFFKIQKNWVSARNQKLLTDLETVMRNNDVSIYHTNYAFTRNSEHTSTSLAHAQDTEKSETGNPVHNDQFSCKLMLNQHYISFTI